MLYLGIDIGTTNIKALLVDTSGRVVSRETVVVETHRGSGGLAEQCISQIYSATCDAVRRAVGDDGEKINAIGISSQGGSLQLFDDNRRPIGRVISWMDERGRPWDDKLTAELGNEFFLRHIGYHKSGICIGQLKRLTESGELAKAAGVGFVGDSIVEKLCGLPAHDATSFAITFLYNPWKNSAAAEILSLTGITGKVLPILMPANSVAGFLTAQAAADMNLRCGIAVCPAVHDQYTASIGAGAVEAGDVCIGTGTAWVLTATTEELCLPVVEGAYVCPHPAGGGGQLVSLGTGGSAIAMVLEEIGEPNASPQRVDELIESAPPGCDGLRCVELSNSVIRFEGESQSHTSGHCVRAVVETLAGKLQNYLDEFLRRDMRIERLIMCGKGATSGPVSGIVADITGMEVSRLVEPDVSAYGAALIAACCGQSVESLKQTAMRLGLCKK